MVFKQKTTFFSFRICENDIDFDENPQLLLECIRMKHIRQIFLSEQGTIAYFLHYIVVEKQRTNKQKTHTCNQIDNQYEQKKYNNNNNINSPQMKRYQTSNKRNNQDTITYTIIN